MVSRLWLYDMKSIGSYGNFCQHVIHSQSPEAIPRAPSINVMGFSLIRSLPSGVSDLKGKISSLWCFEKPEEHKLHSRCRLFHEKILIDKGNLYIEPVGTNDVPQNLDRSQRSKGMATSRFFLLLGFHIDR